MSFTAELKNVDKVIRSLSKMNQVATYRALNAVDKKALNEAAGIVTELYPIRKKDVRKATRQIKAHLHNQSLFWQIKSARLSLPQPRQLKKGGITYKGDGKNRNKLLSQIEGGSKPFVITGKNSGKQLAVFRKRGNKRTVTTMKYHSIPYMFRKAAISSKWLTKYVSNNFPNEYGRQLARAKYS